MQQRDGGGVLCGLACAWWLVLFLFANKRWTVTVITRISRIPWALSECTALARKPPARRIECGPRNCVATQTVSPQNYHTGATRQQRSCKACLLLLRQLARSFWENGGRSQSSPGYLKIIGHYLNARLSLENLQHERSSADHATAWRRGQSHPKTTTREQLVSNAPARPVCCCCDNCCVCFAKTVDGHSHHQDIFKYHWALSECTALARKPPARRIECGPRNCVVTRTVSPQNYHTGATRQQRSCKACCDNCCVCFAKTVDGHSHHHDV